MTQTKIDSKTNLGQEKSQREQDMGATDKLKISQVCGPQNGNMT